MKKIFSIVGLFLVLFSCSTFGQLNYNFSAGSGTFTALTGATSFTWATGATADEGYSTATNIGFSFNYAGTAYETFQVSTNGFLRFGSDLASATSADALDGTLRRIIAPLWDNLSVGSTATDITYLLEGTSPNRILTVEWKNVKWSKTATAANAEFQVKLYETSNKIEIIYGNMAAPTSGGASIGLVDNTVISTAGSATGKFLSINVGGTAGARVYHRSMNLPFYLIANAPDPNTLFSFTPVTPKPIAAGTYTIGGTTPDYKSLSDAAMALNINGIAGPVVFKLREGTYDDIFHLIAVEGTSATNTITLQGEGTAVISPKNGSGGSTAGSSSSSDAIIRMDGTQYTTIQDLTLSDNGQNTTNLKFEIGVLLGNSALNGAMVQGGRFNHLKNLNIDMKCTAGVVHPGSIGLRYFTTGSSETDTSLGTSYNKIENCTVKGFWRSGWKTYGISGANPNRGNVVVGSTFGDFTIASGASNDLRVMEVDCESNLLIEKNKIQNIDVTIQTTNNIYGIWFNPASSGSNTNSGTLVIRDNEISSLKNSNSGVTSGFTVGIACNAVSPNTNIQIYRNKIHDLFSNGTINTAATPVACRVEGILINLGGSTGKPTKTDIYNNMIYDLRAPRSLGDPGVRGLDLQNAAGDGIFSVFNNTIYLDNSTAPAVTGTNVFHRSACLYLANFGAGTLDLKNNIFANTMGTSSTGTGVPAAVCIYASLVSNFPRMTIGSDNNLYFADTTFAKAGIAFDGTKVYRTMADYRAIANMGTRDANSFFADPKTSFVNAAAPYDVHIAPSSWLVKAQGAPIYSVKNDIDGENRSYDIATGPVCIGADEYAATGKPSVTVSGEVADGKTTSFTGPDGKILAQITWHNGTGAVPDTAEFSYQPGTQLNSALGASIFKNYTIKETGGTKGWNADLKLYYNSTTELNGFTESRMKMNQKAGEVWGQLPTEIDLVKHTGSANVTALGDFTFGGLVPTSIAAAKEDANNDSAPDKAGQTFRFDAVVVTGNLAASDTVAKYFINDGTAGILLYSPTKLSKTLAVGDSIQVEGVLGEYKGTTDFVPADSIVGGSGSIVVLKSNAKVPAPVVVSIKDLNSEKYEGNLVVVRNLKKMPSSLPWPAAGQDTVVTVGSGTDSLSLFVDKDTDLDGSAEPEWPLDIVGVVSQDSAYASVNKGYQLIPRNVTDVTVPVYSLAVAREDLNKDFIPDRKGQIIKASGIVVSNDFTKSAAGNNYYVTDGKSGVLLYSATKLSKDLNIGDSISVKGKIDQFKGATEFVPLTTEVGENGSVVVVKSNVAVPAPVEISIADVNSEKYEGMLVVVKNLYKYSSSAAWPVSGKNASMKVGNEKDSTILFIDSDTDIDGTTEVKWPQTITGVISQYTSSTGLNDGYELIPRSVADFKAVTGVETNETKIPASYALDQNYPNPFNPTTTISFDLKANANVTLKIYSILGQEVATLVNGSEMSAGHQTLNFNASHMTSGMYIYRLEVKGIDGSSFIGIKKMMLLK
ncbi:MAG: T9SS type A sorting domain-containing protein [archaeon]